MDHNAPSNSFSFARGRGSSSSVLTFLTSPVALVVDHHVDLGVVTLPEEKKEIAMVGSASTLVSEKCALTVLNVLLLFRFLASPTGMNSLQQSPSLPLLLAGTILLDTINLRPEFGKVTPRDEAALRALSRVIKARNSPSLN